MSIAGRLYNILRAEIEQRLDSAEKRFGIDPEAPFDPSWTPPDEPRARSRQKSTGSAPADGRDPDMVRWYANLEVPYGSDLATVHTAWKKQVRAYHPDRHGQDLDKRDTATEIVKELNNAYEQLKKRLQP